MMCEVVYDRHAPHLTSNLDPALHRFESVKGFLDLFLRDSPRVGRDDHGETVSNIELADQVTFELTPARAVFKNCEPCRVAAEVYVSRLPLCIVTQTES